MLRQFSYTFFLVLHVFATPLHANPSIDITPFLATSYTDGFRRAFDLKLDFQLLEAGQVTKGVMNIQHAEGRAVSFLGQEWIGVEQTGETVINGDKSVIRILLLYDPRTKLQGHSIDLSDESVTTYQWASNPRSLPVGRRTKVGTVIEKDKSGRVVSSGEFDLLVTRLGTGFQICTIETSKKMETSEIETLKDCGQFDAKKQITHSLIELRTGTQSVLTGAGRIRIR